jgi:uncharacterized protein YidB (DUF937 family)
MSNNGLPSLTALLGLLAVAGYQNRDKLSELLNGIGSQRGPGSTTEPQGQQGTSQSAPSQGGLGGLLSGLAGGSGLGGLLSGLGGSNTGGLLGGGLGELVNRLKQNGRGDLADSWVGTGPNKSIEHSEIDDAVGPDVLATLAEKTGLSRDEIARRLSKVLPEAVDQYTPEGKLPSAL